MVLRCRQPTSSARCVRRLGPGLGYPLISAKCGGPQDPANPKKSAREPTTSLVVASPAARAPLTGVASPCSARRGGTTGLASASPPRRGFVTLVVVGSRARRQSTTLDVVDSRAVFPKPGTVSSALSACVERAIDRAVLSFGLYRQ